MNSFKESIAPLTPRPLPPQPINATISSTRFARRSSDTSQIKSALRVAYLSHQGQMRKSGEPFIIHPISVAILLTELSMDVHSVMAGLLHDTVEDTDLTFAEVEALFGQTVRKIVEGETKVSKVRYTWRRVARRGVAWHVPCAKFPRLLSNPLNGSLRSPPPPPLPPPPAAPQTSLLRLR